MRRLSSWCLLWVFAVPANLLSQPPAPDDVIRHQAERILSDPEFRYFDHLNESAERPAERDVKRRHSTGSRLPQGSSGSQGADSSESKSESAAEPGRTASRSADSDFFVPSGGAFAAVGNAVGFVLQMLAYLVLIAVCGLILYLVFLAIVNRETASQAFAPPLVGVDAGLEEHHSPGELPADAYLAKARELANQRQYREALAHLLLGGMSAIERADLIQHRRGLTLRDYLRALRGGSPQFDGFGSLIGLYEPVAFGRRVASFQTFQDALANYEQTVTPLV